MADHRGPRRPCARVNVQCVRTRKHVTVIRLRTHVVIVAVVVATVSPSYRCPAARRVNTAVFRLVVIFFYFFFVGREYFFKRPRRRRLPFGFCFCSIFIRNIKTIVFKTSVLDFTAKGEFMTNAYRKLLERSSYNSQSYKQLI